MADISPVIQEVENLTTVADSVVAFANGVANQIDAAVAEAVAANDAADLSALTAVASDIRGQADRIAAAVVSNTPAAEG